MNEIFGEGDRGELTADHWLDAICGEDNSSNFSSRLASDEYSLVDSTTFNGLGKILFKGGRKEGVAGVGGVDMPEDRPDAPRSSISRYSWACKAHRFVISASINMEPKLSDSGARQMFGKSLPKTGVSAKRICQQKVAATAFAASNGIQYPDQCISFCDNKPILSELTLRNQSSSSNAMADLLQSHISCQHLCWGCLRRISLRLVGTL